MILDSDWLLEAERGLILDITIAPSAEVPKVSKRTTENMFHDGIVAMSCTEQMERKKKQLRTKRTKRQNSCTKQ